MRDFTESSGPLGDKPEKRTFPSDQTLAGQKILASRTRPRHRRRTEVRFRPTLEALEDRWVPAVHLLSDFSGLKYDPTMISSNNTAQHPPDTNAAVGLYNAIEVVNNSIAVYDKVSGLPMLSQRLDSSSGTNDGFFATGLNAQTYNMTDPVVAYDEVAQRFIVGMLDNNYGVDPTESPPQNKAYFDIAVSIDNYPTNLTSSWSFQRLDLSSDPNFTSNNFWIDYPKIGWNSDAWVMSFLMFQEPSGGGTAEGEAAHHVDIVSVTKTSNPSQSQQHKLYDVFTQYGPTALSGAPAEVLVPARMHGAVTGSPVWMVGSEPGSGSAVVYTIPLTNVATSPTLDTTDNLVTAVNSNYYDTGAITELNNYQLTWNDARMLSADWRGGYLAAAHTASDTPGGFAHARYYVFHTPAAASGTITLVQQDEINPGTGVSTFMPSVAIAATSGANGTVYSLGTTYLEASSIESLSMYVTAEPDLTAYTQNVTNYFEAGHASAPAQAVYVEVANAVVQDSGAFYPWHTGDYSAIQVDPANGVSFWASNEFANKPPDSYPVGTADNPAYWYNWGTEITQFEIAGAVAAPGWNPAPYLISSAGALDAGTASVPGRELTTVSRLYNHIDAFSIGQNGQIYTSSWGGDSGWGIPSAGWAPWYSLGMQTFPTNTKITATAYDSYHMDVFAIDGAGTIWHDVWADPQVGGSGWGTLVQIQTGFVGGSVVTVVPDGHPTYSPSLMEMFAINSQGNLYHWNLYQGILYSQSYIGLNLVPGGTVAATSPSPGVWDVFAVWTAYLDGNYHLIAGSGTTAIGSSVTSSFNTWSSPLDVQNNVADDPLSPGSFPSTGYITALRDFSGGTTNLYAFLVDTSGHIFEAYSANGGTSWSHGTLPATPTGSLAPGQQVAALSRPQGSGTVIDLFAVDSLKRLWAAEWSGGLASSSLSWNSLEQGYAAAGAYVDALNVYSDQSPYSFVEMDLFYIDKDGYVRTRWWSDVN